MRAIATQDMLVLHMGGALVLELQRLAQTAETGLSELLRRAKVVAVKLDLEDARSWIEYEMNGYPPKVELPSYRVIPSELRVKNPFHGWNAVAWGGPNPLQEHFASTDIRSPISEVEVIATPGVGDPHSNVDQSEMDALLATGNDRFSSLPTARFYSRASFVGILEGVRGKVLDWVLALEKKGVLGEGMTFNEKEKQGAAEVILPVEPADQARLRAKLNNGETPIFEEPFPWLTQVPSEFVINRQWFASVVGVDVLLVTATETERNAVLRRMAPVAGHEKLIKVPFGKDVYFVGMVGEALAVLVMSRIGAGMRDGALPVVADAISVCHPRAVIAVGIAWGMKTRDLKMGDVLVSSSLIPFDQMRREGGGSTPRGAQPEAGGHLLSRFRSETSMRFTRPDGRVCQMRVGALLSGESLVDDLEFKVGLHRQFPHAIGGEMEGLGVYGATAKHHGEWIIVKAICDWGDGMKSDDYQTLAAASAMSLVEQVISSKDTLHDLTNMDTSEAALAGKRVQLEHHTREVQRLKSESEIRLIVSQQAPTSHGAKVVLANFHIENRGERHFVLKIFNCEARPNTAFWRRVRMEPEDVMFPCPVKLKTNHVVKPGDIGQLAFKLTLDAAHDELRKAGLPIPSEWNWDYLDLWLHVQCEGGGQSADEKKLMIRPSPQNT